MIKVSFILPCYNVERYVADCLDSIYAQDLSEEEFEVICVNDCSTDGTRSIIVNYASQHPNLMLIDHKQNLNVGAARNSGMEVAKGEYIWFVDPDDTIKPDSLQNVYKTAKEKDAEILMFNYESKKEGIERKVFSDTGILGGQEYVITYFPGRFSEFSIVWRCLFKTSFLKHNAIEFPKISKAEDVSFLWKAMLKAKRVCSVDGVYYTHIDNPNSIAHNTIKANIAFCERIMFAYQIDVLLTEEGGNIDVALVNSMIDTAKWCSNSSIGLLRQMSNKGLVGYYAEIVDHKNELKRVRGYMNRKYALLYDTSLGKTYWLLKAKLMCKLCAK